MLREPALQFRGAPSETKIPPESNEGSVFNATALVPANPTDRALAAKGLATEGDQEACGAQSGATAQRFGEGLPQVSEASLRAARARLMRRS